MIKYTTHPRPTTSNDPHYTARTAIGAAVSMTHTDSAVAMHSRSARHMQGGQYTYNGQPINLGQFNWGQPHVPSTTTTVEVGIFMFRKSIYICVQSCAGLN